MSASSPRHVDHELVQTLLTGSLPAWHRFVDRYAALICAVLRRKLHDEEAVRTAFADVLSDLYHGKLRRYEGESALSTWLVVVTGRHAVDVNRKQRGRCDAPAAVRQLPDLEQRIYRWYLVEGRSLGEIRDLLVRSDGNLTFERIVEAVRALLDALTDRMLRRLDYAAGAAATSYASGIDFELADLVLEAARERQGDEGPEREFLRREALETAQRIEHHLAALPALERTVLELKFDRGMSAPRIAKEMQIESPRRVYTLVEQALAELRRRLAGNSG